MYCDKVIEEFEHPFHMEILKEYTHKIHNTNSGCGDEAYIYIKFIKNRIEDIGFQSFGCASCLAMVSYLCRSIHKKSISELNNFTRSFFEEAFNELEPSQKHCIDMGEIIMEKIKAGLRGVPL